MFLCTAEVYKHFIYVITRQEQITLVSKKLNSIKTTLVACLPITCTYVITVNRAELLYFQLCSEHHHKRPDLK